MTILSVVCLILLAFTLYLKKGQTRLDRDNVERLSENNQLNASNIDLHTRNVVLERENQIIKESIEKERQQIVLERVRMIELVEKERKQLTEQFGDKFQALANDILEQKTKTMSEANHKGVESLLKPMGEQLERFRQQVEKEGRQRALLQDQVKQLSELNLQITKDANNLTSAIKGNSKVQGDWGEMILQTLLESSGLVKGTHFYVQENLKSDDGANLRPDVILHLPENKEVVIDSKVSLTSYVAFCQSEVEQQRNVYLSKHIASVRKHIDELGVKNYHKLVNSPDFVIMFVPNEPAFLLALQSDENLWQYAYAKGVVMSSPTNLFSILKIVEDLWRRDSQSKNAIEIANAGGELYDKIALFVENFEDLGRTIDKSSAMFAKTKGQLSEGRGNILRRAERMKKMGATTTKQISTLSLDASEDD